VKFIVNIRLLKSISSGAQYVTIGKKKHAFSHPSSAVFFFATSPIKSNQTETGTVNWWEITNSKPPGPIIMMGQSEEH
jgi:hypothetical protein